MDDFILTINAGSSSLKFALFRMNDVPVRVWSGKFDRIGAPPAKATFTDWQTNRHEERTLDAADHTACIPGLMDFLKRNSDAIEIRAIGHRIVHGGQHYLEPSPIDSPMLEELQTLRVFDPDHLPAELALVKYFAKHFPRLTQVACFDTAFHRDLPAVAKLLPIPRKYAEQGVRRYGFHGLSYSYLMRELEREAGTETAQGRIILAHLGNGASMAAVHRGHCLDTTMAFSPTAGLVMSTRSGDLDPGVAAFLARKEGMTTLQFYRMVNTQAGLLGISETSSDTRDLLERESHDTRAAEALAVFCYQAKKWIGAFSAVLGGLETLVFAGGIGENSDVLRGRICAGLAFLGIDLDPQRNRAGAGVISRDTSRVTVRVIRTDEELEMATSVCQCVAKLSSATRSK